jgi:DNA-binding winged helix-turn-helix (wHTH) protein/TolB-like protein
LARQYAFGEFRLDGVERRLTRGGEPVRVEPRSFDLLCYLVENPGRLVTKQELLDRVWSGVVVTDNALTRCVHQVRAALGDTADAPRFVETVPGFGYRFVGEVTVDDLGTAVPGRRRRPLLLALGAVTAVAVAVFLGWIFIRQGGGADVSIERVAVLPFSNLTGSREQDNTILGMHDAVISELSRHHEIDVISRTSVLPFRSGGMTVPEIAGRLDVDVVLEGVVVREGSETMVSTQLIAASPERHLAADRYEVDRDRMLESAGRIAADVAAELGLEPLPPRPAPAAASLVDPEAYDAYAEGRFRFERKGLNGYRQARDSYQRAMEIAPDFAPAYVGAAHTYGGEGVFGLRRPSDAFPTAEALAKKAIELDDTLVDAYLILAGVRLYWDRDFASAENLARHALDLDPNSAHGYRMLSAILSATDRHADALKAVQHGRDLDPLPPTSQLRPVLTRYLGGDYPGAIDEARQRLEYFPEFWPGHWLLCIALSASARQEEAASACESAVAYSGGTPRALGSLGYVYAMAGRKAEAREVIAELERLAGHRYVGAVNLAMIHGALGELDRAFAALVRAYREHDVLLVHINSYRFFDTLRNDARFLSMSMQRRRDD